MDNIKNELATFLQDFQPPNSATVFVKKGVKPSQEFIEVVDTEKAYHVSQEWCPIGIVRHVKNCLENDQLTGEDIVYTPQTISPNQSIFFNSNSWQFSNILLD